MMLSHNGRPSPLAMILAIAAAVALSASAFAGADAAKRTVTKAQVKKLAKKVVRKQAPKLTVANARNLDGQAAGAYLDRAVQQVSGANAIVPVPGTAATEVLAPVSIDVPAGVRFVRVDGSAAFEGNPMMGTSALWFQQDGPCEKSGFGYANYAFVDQELQQTSFHLLVEVTPGTHSFRLCASSNLPTEARARSLLVETVARGASG